MERHPRSEQFITLRILDVCYTVFSLLTGILPTLKSSLCASVSPMCTVTMMISNGIIHKFVRSKREKKSTPTHFFLENPRNFQDSGKPKAELTRQRTPDNELGRPRASVLFRTSPCAPWRGHPPNSSVVISNTMIAVFLWKCHGNSLIL